jgi:RNA polymerase subunit RPABC4/transcription elongation factor Spt4
MSLVNCSDCERSVSDTSIICPHCGSRDHLKVAFREAVLNCPECSCRVERETSTCGNCGHPISAHNELSRKSKEWIVFSVSIAILILNIIAPFSWPGGILFSSWAYFISYKLALKYHSQKMEEYHRRERVVLKKELRSLFWKSVGVWISCALMFEVFLLVVFLVTL